MLVMPEQEREAALGRIRAFPREQGGDRRRRVHPPDADRRAARPAAADAPAPADSMIAKPKGYQLCTSATNYVHRVEGIVVVRGVIWIPVLLDLAIAQRNDPL